MSRYEVRAFQPSDYANATRHLYPWQNAEQVGALYGSRGPAFSAFVDGELAACAGVVILLPGLGEAWATITDVGRKHGVFLTRVVTRGLGVIIRQNRLRRVQADAVEAHTAAIKFLRVLGFAREGAMKLYGPAGETFVRMVRFPVLPDHEEPALVDGAAVTRVLRQGADGRDYEYMRVGARLVPALSGGEATTGTLAIIGIVAALASTAVGTYAAYQQGEAQAEAATYNRKVAENQAVSAENAAKAHADQQRDAYRRILASNQAAVGASGVATDVGSPLLVMADNAAQAELNAQMTEWGGRTRATGFRSEIPLLRQQADYARKAGTLGAGRTLLAGAANTADRAYSFWGTPSSTTPGRGTGWGGPYQDQGWIIN